MTKGNDLDVAKARAEALFRQQRADGGRQTVEAVQNAEGEKIARLRALRLAKEETERKAAQIRKARRLAR